MIYLYILGFIEEIGNGELFEKSSSLQNIREDDFNFNAHVTSDFESPAFWDSHR